MPRARGLPLLQRIFSVSPCLRESPFFKNGRDERSTLFAALGLCVRNWFEGKRRVRA